MPHALFAIGFILAVIPTALAGEPLVVHEWGTFTSLQDEAGQSIGGINTDDEPVPDFVNQPFANFLIKSPAPPALAQGAPRAHPGVTMRLETPVIYFHPPAKQSQEIKLDVNVTMFGGWLSEYYPAAKFFDDGDVPHAELNESTMTELLWEDLTIGGNALGPETTFKTWLAPRRVKAASVTTTNGQSERFLFYRGVANLDSPLRVQRHGHDDTLMIRAQPGMTDIVTPFVVKRLWLADIQADGRVAFKALGPLQWSKGQPIDQMKISSGFQPNDYAKENITTLRASMHEAIVADGLFADEADALLNTWQASYFQSPGMRLFFLVPQPWTDNVMPLEISVPAKVARVMVGRIELVTAKQRAPYRILTGSIKPGKPNRNCTSKCSRDRSRFRRYKRKFPTISRHT